MLNPEENILQWLNGAEHAELPAWASLPSIPLYMDQVMMFTGEALSLYAPENGQNLLTSSMVNNYVKSGLVDHPDHKRYGRMQLAQLVMTGLLKQVLSIQDLAVLFGGPEDTESLYSAFADAQNGALRETVERVRGEMDEDKLRALAMRLAAEANARRAVAERILSALSTSPEKGEKSSQEKQKR